MFGGVFPSLPRPLTHITSPSFSFVCINVTDVITADPSWAKMMLDSTLTEVKEEIFMLCYN